MQLQAAKAHDAHEGSSVSIVNALMAYTVGLKALETTVAALQKELKD